MSTYIDDAPIAVCDRCRVKMLHKKLSPDRDKPGLLVCKACNDEKDPWKLPFSPKDANIAVPRARPDTSIANDVCYVVNDAGEVVEGACPVDTSVYPRSN